MYKFDKNNEQDAQQEEEELSTMSFNEATQDVLSVVVRICGLMMLFIGMWIAIQVFNEALGLYKEPANIERMAIAIEKGSNIDKSLRPIRDTILGGEEGEDGEVTTQAASEPASNNFRVSYFIAWIVEILLLLLLARIAIMAVKTGGELALYDAQVKRLARYIVKANRKE